MNLELIPAVRTLDRSEPALRISGRTVVFNMAAARLLGLEEGGFVQFRIEARSERTRLYVGAAPSGLNAFRLARRRDRRVLHVNSIVLAHYLGGALEGEGLYRVCPSDPVVDAKGSPWYWIFFKRY